MIRHHPKAGFLLQRSEYRSRSRLRFSVFTRTEMLLPLRLRHWWKPALNKLERRISPLLELPSTYESYQALLEEFTSVMKEEQACFVVLLSMEDVNNLKWKLGMLWNEYFEICFLVFTIFISCITFSYYWYKAFFNTEYKLLLMTFSKLSEKKKN